MHGRVLAENTIMLRMCAELGFQIEDDPGERGVKIVTLDLAASTTDQSHPEDLRQERR